jgi:hypothetical protein
VGFLKFLKRDKKKEFDLDLDKLDVPPVMPGMDGKNIQFPDLPELPEMPEFEEKPPIKDDFPVEKLKSDIPTIPIKKEEARLDTVKARFKPLPEVKPIREARQKPAENRIKAVEKPVHHEAHQPVYVRVDKFKDVLRNVTTIKNQVKISNDVLAKLNEIDANREKEFGNWRSSLLDLQKKLIFIDKTLFKR